MGQGRQKEALWSALRQGGGEWGKKTQKDPEEWVILQERIFCMSGEGNAAGVGKSGRVGDQKEESTNGSKMKYSRRIDEKISMKKVKNKTPQRTKEQRKGEGRRTCVKSVAVAKGVREADK